MRGPAQQKGATSAAEQRVPHWFAPPSALATTPRNPPSTTRRVPRTRRERGAGTGPRGGGHSPRVGSRVKPATPLPVVIIM